MSAVLIFWLMPWQGKKTVAIEILLTSRNGDRKKIVDTITDC